jgi:predicted MFS family arabinose efflux permease
MGTNLGWAIGPALGGLLSTVLPYGIVFFCAAPTLLIGAFLTSRIVDPIEHSEGEQAPRVSLREAAREALQRLDVSLILGCAFVFALCHVQLFSTLSIYASSELLLGNEDVGLVYMANGIAVLMLQIPAVALIARIGNDKALISGALLYIVAFIGIGLAPGFGGVVAAVLVLTVGEVMLSPAQQAVVANLSDPKRIGRAFGLFGTMQMLGVAFAPLLGGTVYDHFRTDGLAMWGILAGLPLLLAIGYGAFAAIRAADHASDSADTG